MKKTAKLFSALALLTVATLALTGCNRCCQPNNCCYPSGYDWNCNPCPAPCDNYCAPACNPCPAPCAPACNPCPQPCNPCGY